MGKRSVKENKNVYQLAREEAGLTRAKASEKMEFISDDRIEKIENEKSQPHPDEVLAMEKAYHKLSLSNYYCSHECPIGRETVPEIREKDLPQITLEILAAVNHISSYKDRLIEISADGRISEDEYRDFALIRRQLTTITETVDSLRLWMNKMIDTGHIDRKALEKAAEDL